jgi:hypothetical protein
LTHKFIGYYINSTNFYQEVKRKKANGRTADVLLFRLGVNSLDKSRF